MYALWFNIRLLTGASASGAAPVTPPTSATPGSYNFHYPRKKRKIEEKPVRLDIITLGTGAKEIITGLVSKARDRTATEKDRIRKLQLADDEWLLMN